MRSEKTSGMMTEDYQFRVASRCELLPYLISLPLGLSRKQANILLRFRAVTLQRKALVRHDAELWPNDVVTIAVRKRPRDDALERNGLKIIHLDDAVVVVDKPTGLLSIGSEREKERTTHRLLNEHLKTLTRSRLQQAFIVHRLDRETSGLMIFARNQSIQAILQQNWKMVSKRYLAVVEGSPANDQERSKTILWKAIHSWFIVSIRVARCRSHIIAYCAGVGTSRCSSLRSKPDARTRSGFSWLRSAIQSSAIWKYGARTDPARRLALHSCELKFRHPVSGASMEFQSGLPAQLKQLFEPRVATHEK